jgi:hypothetical protein
MRPIIAGAALALTLFSIAVPLRPEEGSAPPKPTAPAEPEGMVPLLDGKGLSGWEGDPRLWSFKDGAVRAESTKENPCNSNSFLIWKGGTLGDFELRLSFRIERGNSGIQYRSRHVPPKEGDANRWVVSGYQAEVENTPGKVGFLYHERGRGYLCNVGEKVEVGADGKPKVVGSLGDREAIGKTYKKSDWNDYVIIAKGNRLVHYLNGVQTVDVVDNDPKGGAASGILALQIHSGPPMVVEFKNIRLKQYEAASPAGGKKE